MAEEKDEGSIWDHARAYANLLGTVPSSFATAIRGLKSDSDKKQPLTRGTVFQAGRLANSPSLGVGFQYAAKTFRGEEVQKRGMLTGKDYFEIFDPETLGALIGMSYFYKKAKILAADEEWTQYTKNIHYQTDLAGFLGYNIPKIGLGKGLLVGGMDTIAVTCFHLHDKKGFTDYRRVLKTKNVRADLRHEQERWGCTRYHVAGILIQQMGFGVNFANSYAIGMLADDAGERLIDADAYTFRIAQVWLAALEATGAPPDRAMRVEYYPDAKGLSAIKEAAENLKRSGSMHSWLDKTKDELVSGVPDEPTPQED